MIQEGGMSVLLYLFLLVSDGECDWFIKIRGKGRICVQRVYGGGS